MHRAPRALLESILRIVAVAWRLAVSQRVAATLLLAFVVWAEVLAQHAVSFFWSQPTNINRTDCLRALLVADPQLVGYQYEPWWIGPISRWDADRYLQRGYGVAYAHSHPDLVIYMGDLFDEGVNASPEEREWTMDRFRSVFRPGLRGEQLIFIAGDNDIGGEWERVDPRLVHSFRRIFPNKIDRDAVALRHFDIYELFTFNMDLRRVLERNGATQKILLSHTPITKLWTNALKRASEMNISLILSAHDHTAYVYSHLAGLHWSSAALDWAGTPLEETVGPGRPLLEIQTPTCSYRMGVSQMAYGDLQLCAVGVDHRVYYNLLNLPGRYPQLAVLLLLVSWNIVLISLSGIQKLCRKRRYSKIGFVCCRLKGV